MDLDIKTWFIGRHILFFDTLNSTNVHATNIIAKNEPCEGTAIITRQQAQGKGQYGNKWESAPNKNIHLSIIVKPSFLSSSQQFLLSMMCGLAIRQLMYHFLPQKDVSIKWPNDIYVGDHKIAGILIENIFLKKQISYAVLGIGININQEQFISAGANPISLFQLTGKKHLLEDIIPSLFIQIEHYYLKLKQNSKEISSLYMKHLYKRNTPTPMIDQHGHFIGTIIGVNKAGLLEVWHHIKKKQIQYAIKEVSIEIK